MLAGNPDANGVARAVWTCKKCGAGQVMELSISKDARRGDLRKIIGGLALAGNPADARKAELQRRLQQAMGSEQGEDD